MALNTKYLTPAETTGFVRGRIEQYAQGDVLAQVLPDQTVDNIAVRFAIGDAGITPEAEARDWDAQPGSVELPKSKRRTIDLVAFSSRITVSESDALMSRLAGGEGYANLIKRAGDTVAQSIFNRAKRLRGTVLASGKATIDQENFGIDEDFGRDAALTAALAQLVSASGSDALAQLGDFVDIYEEKSGGTRPAYALASTKAINAFLRHAQFASKVNDVTRPATLEQVNQVLLAADLPQLVRYNDKIGQDRVLPEDRLILVPDYVNGGGDLGATIWGLTESSFKPEFSSVGGALPGAVAAVWDTEGTAGKTVVDADSTFLPILKNANLSASLKVI
ncbi:major capsid protein [Brachybacterium subflavum]|uniref:major capsid protein n=1 Tax=Brachybacterium subflavum TaxID=2585206 RepID=UPI001266850E|nr:major capsid protein [Brachybacterium subflavum]